jgi:DNA-binding transcriptional LysR family regulator
LDLKHLQHLVLLAEELHFGRAATRASLSQSAFTRSIQALESDAGLRLFDRDKHFVKLTPVGARMLERARRLLAEARDLKRDLDYVRTGAIGHVAMGFGPYPASMLMVSAVTRMHRLHPDVNVRVEIQNAAILLERLKAEQIDFFVAGARHLPNLADLSVRLLADFDTGHYCRAGHPALKLGKIRFADLARWRVAAMTLPESYAAMARDYYGLAADAELPVALQCDNLHMLIEVALRTDMIVAGPNAAMRAQVAAGALVALRNVEHLPARTLHAEVALVRIAGRTLAPASEIMIGLIESSGDKNVTRRAGRPAMPAMPAKAGGGNTAARKRR